MNLLLFLIKVHTTSLKVVKTKYLPICFLEFQFHSKPKLLVPPVPQNKNNCIIYITKYLFLHYLPGILAGLAHARPANVLSTNHQK